jgi:mycoredoxin
MENITIYGASWCPDCKRSKDFLDSKQIKYDYIDIDTVSGAADKVAEINNGLKRIPTIVFSDGSVLVEPSNREIENKITQLH